MLSLLTSSDSSTKRNWSCHNQDSNLAPKFSEDKKHFLMQSLQRNCKNESHHAFTFAGISALIVLLFMSPFTYQFWLHKHTSFFLRAYNDLLLQLEFLEHFAWASPLVAMVMVLIAFTGSREEIHSRVKKRYSFSNIPSLLK